MRKYENVVETLDALEEEISRSREEGARLGVEFVPDRLIVALYRLAEVQIAYALEAGDHGKHGGWEGFERENARFEAHEKLGEWIEAQRG